MIEMESEEYNSLTFRLTKLFQNKGWGNFWLLFTEHLFLVRENHAEIVVQCEIWNEGWG